MEIFTKQQWSDKHISQIQLLINRNWIRCLDIEIFAAKDVPLKTVDSVCQAVNEAIDSIGLNHKISDTLFDSGLQELIDLTAPNNSPLVVKQIMPYFRKEDSKFNTLTNNYYTKTNGIKIIVSRNNGIYREMGINPKAEAQVYSGLIYLPIPKERENELMFTKDLVKHELGHVLGVKVEHHNNLSNNASQKRPYLVLGYRDCNNCFMGDKLDFRDLYVSDKIYCERFLDSARTFWKVLGTKTGIKYIN